MFLDPDGNELEAIWEPPREVLERALNPAALPCRGLTLTVRGRPCHAEGRAVRSLGALIPGREKVA